jgi:hypothetical protein
MQQSTRGTERETFVTARAFTFGISIALGVVLGRLAVEVAEPRVGYWSALAIGFVAAVLGATIPHLVHRHFRRSRL